jgi:hypothetical protein
MLALMPTQRVDKLVRIIAGSLFRYMMRKRQTHRPVPNTNVDYLHTYLITSNHSLLLDLNARALQLTIEQTRLVYPLCCRYSSHCTTDLDSAITTFD